MGAGYRFVQRKLAVTVARVVGQGGGSMYQGRHCLKSNGETVAKHYGVAQKNCLLVLRIHVAACMQQRFYGWKVACFACIVKWGGAQSERKMAGMTGS